MIERTLGRMLGTQVVEVHLGEEHTYQFNLDLRRMAVAYRDYVGVLTPDEALEQVEIPGTGSFTKMELVDHTTKWGDPIGIAWAQSEIETEYDGYPPFPYPDPDKPYLKLDYFRARINPQSMVSDVENRFRYSMVDRLIADGRIPRVDFSGILPFCYIPPRADSENVKPHRIALTKVQAAEIRERVEVAAYSEKTQEMGPEQLNEQLQQVLGFISGNPSLDIPTFNVVNPKDGDERMLSEIYAILKGRYKVLLNLAPISNQFRKKLDRLLFVHYVMLPGGVGIDDSTREGLEANSDNNIFIPNQAKGIERVWYHNTYREVRDAFNWIVKQKLSTEEEEKWRLDWVEQWHQEFVVCHGEEP